MKKFTTSTLCLLLASVILFSSCSTIIQGSRQQITIQSLTKDSKIYVDGEDKGKDNASVRLKRNRNHAIAIKKDGYETKIINLEKRTQAGYIVADALLGLTGFGLAWIIVDAATGSWSKFDQDAVVVELEKSK
jgi:PEGA domain